MLIKDLVVRGAVRPEPSIIERFEGVLPEYRIDVPVFVVLSDQLLGPDFLILISSGHLICLRVPIYLQLIKRHPGVDLVQVILQVSELLRFFAHRFLRTVETFVRRRVIEMIIVKARLNIILYGSGKFLA